MVPRCRSLWQTHSRPIRWPQVLHPCAESGTSGENGGALMLLGDGQHGESGRPPIDGGAGGSRRRTNVEVTHESSQQRQADL